MTEDQYHQDRAIIRELIENWVVWRDTSHWDEFRKVWHPDGRMTASWKQAGYEEFIAATREGMDKGVSILHLLGGSGIKVNGSRAISQTKIVISQRASVDGVLCDVTCLARHYDFWEKRKGRWGLVLRESIYDKSRLDPVEAGAKLPIDENLYGQFPAEYAALAYLQVKIGFIVRRGMPHGLQGPSVEALYARGDAWLAGKLDKPWTSPE
jgi:hypothetical protein